MANPTLNNNNDIVDWDWEDGYAGGGETEQTVAMNTPNGTPIVMRFFDFELPALPPEQFPTPEQLIGAHKSRLTAFLWRDELIPVHDMKVVFAKDKRSFKIVVPCIAKSSSTILEKPQTLQEHLANKNTP